MLTTIHKLLGRKKAIKDISSLSGWGMRELISFGWTLGMRVLRGGIVRARLSGIRGVVLCEKGVRLYHPWHIKAGRALNLEEGCEIVGLSRRGIVFGERCTVGRFAVIRPTNVLVDEPGEGLKMGDNSNVGAYSYIGCSGYVDIGCNVIVGPRVSLLAEDHAFESLDLPIKNQGVRRRAIKIENDCWIGAGAIILAGVTVGTGSVIGAGAVVTKDIPPRSVALGVPARVTKSRNPSHRKGPG